MTWKRKWSKNSNIAYSGRKYIQQFMGPKTGLYLILDTQVCDYERLLIVLKESVRGGVDIVQLRDKYGSARDILKFSSKVQKFLKGKIPYILNDRVDLASIACCSGVHLGQEDIPVQLARKMLGPKAIIGASCQTLHQAKEAVRQGADYIGFGSVFKTQTKPERVPMDLKLLTKVIHMIKIPVFPIGGINRHNIKGLGVQNIAVCRAICQAKNVKQSTAHLKQMIAQYRKATHKDPIIKLR